MVQKLIFMCNSISTFFFVYDYTYSLYLLDFYQKNLKEFIIVCFFAILLELNQPYLTCIKSITNS